MDIVLGCCFFPAWIQYWILATTLAGVCNGKCWIWLKKRGTCQYARFVYYHHKIFLVEKYVWRVKLFCRCFLILVNGAFFGIFFPRKALLCKFHSLVLFLRGGPQRRGNISQKIHLILHCPLSPPTPPLFFFFCSLTAFIFSAFLMWQFSIFLEAMYPPFLTSSYLNHGPTSDQDKNAFRLYQTH